MCKHYGWDAKKLCGPVVMAYDLGGKEGNCNNEKHSLGCAHHLQPFVGGKPFASIDHRDELAKLKLCWEPPELARDHKANKKPPGSAKLVDGVLVYPARHFA